MNLNWLLDPDRNVATADKKEHAAGSLAVTWLAALVLGAVGHLLGHPLPLGLLLVLAWLAALAVAVAFEGGQWDIARHVPDYHVNLGNAAWPTAPVEGTLRAPLKPGFGVGVYDLAADALGATAGALLWALGALIL